jgi:hypothetical protein
MKSSYLSIQRDYERRWTRNVAILRDYNAGLPTNAIAAKYEMSIGGISRIARHMGCKKRRPGNSPETRKAVEIEYRSGRKIKDICDDHGVDRKTVWVICQQAGVPLRKGLKPTEVRK